MKCIDVHTHILPPELPRWSEKFGVPGFIALKRTDPCTAQMLRSDGTVFRTVESNCWDPAARQFEGMQVLSTVPVMFSYWAKPEHGLEVARFLNDHLAAACAKEPARFVGLGTLPMQAPELAVRELERCMKLGLAGVQIGSHVNQWNLSEPALFPVFQRAAELSAAVFVHPWDMMGQERMQKYWLPWLVGMPAEVSLAICSLIFGGVLERLPRLRICFAHGGGAFPFTLGRLNHGWHVRPEGPAAIPKEPREYARRIWVDSLSHGAGNLKFIVEQLGADRVVIGSDYPFDMGFDDPVAALAESGLSPDVQARIADDNARAFLDG
jgi:aminocarboxymuconate-semialdehyde decarboxylase